MHTFTAEQATHMHGNSGLWNAALEYAHRRAARERKTIYVYARGGVAFVRAAYEPKPEGAVLIWAVTL